MLMSAPDAICASPYGLGSERVRTPGTVNALPGSRATHRTPNRQKLLGDQPEPAAGSPSKAAKPTLNVATRVESLTTQTTAPGVLQAI